MPYIYKDNNNYVIYSSTAFDDYDPLSFDNGASINETITNVNNLDKFIIDITEDADGIIEQSDYEQILRIDAMSHKDGNGPELTELTGDL